MTHILHIDSSILNNNSVSKELTKQLVDKLAAKLGQATVTYRDLGNEAVPHLDNAHLTSIMTPAEDRNEKQQQQAAYSDQQIEQVQAADIIVLGAPMYNFSVASGLKAWFDHIARAGVTFRYTANGPEGLLKNKKVYLVTSRGGFHQNQPSDTQLPFVETFLKFIGLDDIDVIYAEGVNLGDSQRQTALETASKKISETVAESIA